MSQNLRFCFVSKVEKTQQSLRCFLVRRVDLQIAWTWLASSELGGLRNYRHFAGCLLMHQDCGLV